MAIHQFLMTIRPRLRNVQLQNEPCSLPLHEELQILAHHLGVSAERILAYGFDKGVALYEKIDILYTLCGAAFPSPDTYDVVVEV